MLLNCHIGADSWESLGLQGDPTSPSSSKLVLNIHWKDWCWSWNSKTLATWCEELTGKDLDAVKDWQQEDKGATEDEMVGWHHRLDGHEFEQAPGVGDGKGSLMCYSPWGHIIGHNWATEINWETAKMPALKTPVLHIEEAQVYHPILTFFSGSQFWMPVVITCEVKSV